MTRPFDAWSKYLIQTPEDTKRKYIEKPNMFGLRPTLFNFHVLVVPVFCFGHVLQIYFAVLKEKTFLI